MNNELVKRIGPSLKIYVRKKWNFNSHRHYASWHPRTRQCPWEDCRFIVVINSGMRRGRHERGITERGQGSIGTNKELVSFSRDPPSATQRDKISSNYILPLNDNREENLSPSTAIGYEKQNIGNLRITNKYTHFHSCVLCGNKFIVILLILVTVEPQWSERIQTHRHLEYWGFQISEVFTK